MKKDLIITFITEFVVLGSGILVYRLAAGFLGEEGFSEYALSRRTVSLIQPALILGFGVGIPRYIAFAHASSNKEKPDTYFIGGISVLLFVALIFTLALNLFKGKFAFLLFGDSNYAHFMFPINLMLLGLILHASCYSYFRGRLFMLRANLLQMINLGLVPLLAFTLGNTTKQVLEITGLSWLIVSALFLLLIVWGIEWENKNLVPYTKELLTYGLRRVPGDFGLAILLTLPAILTAHIAGVKVAGSVAFGISLLNMSGTAFAPIGLILLPKAAQIIASKDFRTLRYYISKLLRITLVLTVIGVIFFEVFADKIIYLYLGKSFSDSDIVLVARIIMIGAIAYTIYVAMRSIIDACSVTAINTKNILISLSVFLVLSGVAILSVGEYIYIPVCFTFAIFVLGALTLFETRKILVEHEENVPNGANQ